MPMFRYYATKPAGQVPAAAKAVHTNFLRTGRIARAEDWHAEERRFLTHQEVAARTGMRLENAGRKTHQRLNTFHQKIRFPEVIFHKTLAQAPHLGYVHVTASKTDFAEYKDITWGFYIANFSAEITADEQFFKRISPGYSRMYFAVAMKAGEDGATRRPVLNREVRDNGVLFRTADPMTALRNVLMLGARNAELRKIVEAIG
ncbi:MAG: hypothetical protein KUA43_09710 [Hoeflea sp.]|nr:DUF6656 family protein [Hoeflea sp.]MBU4528451.1 hypothetical protein [Alphaproteobacteria bacterium]MBU4543120.1 hypothetical protein [Alphaproteobacteria bacterium]MBU4551811.1 hypothetical protein [Alphaproteobacteria bacterium]MBV1723706.1 hypothetical protein [Hoeflea sp.]MBV1762022.1 hypothetical protein [Hoeflea sp.]